MRILSPRLFLLLFLFPENFLPAAELQWQTETGYRWAQLSTLNPQPINQPTGFTLLGPAQTGLTFTNCLDERAIAVNRVLANGSGLATGDIFHDGLPAIFFCGLDGHCALYKNLGGYKFQDITATSGIVTSNLICRGAVFADINGDGWPDLLVSTSGNGVLVFTNRHDGTFADISTSAGLLSQYGAGTLALADVDGNGTLDIYVANYRKDSVRDRADLALNSINGKLSIPPALHDRLTISTHGALLEYGEPDQLYLNDGKGHFTPVSWTNGAFLDESGKPLTNAPLDWGLTAMFQDVNGDGAPDLYVCNDYWTPDRFWINDGHGHFRAAPRVALRHITASSMGVDFADIDHDGNVDFMVVDMLSRDLGWRKRQKPSYNMDLVPPDDTGDRPQVTRNTLMHSHGDGTFEEIAAFSGVTASEWSWQPIFMDVDLDGWDDVLIITGFHRDIQDRDKIESYREAQRANRFLPPKLGPDGQPVARTRQEMLTEGTYKIYLMEDPLRTPIVAYKNMGGLKFAEAGPQWGLDQPGIRTGIALGDLDNRGSLDFVTTSLCGPAEIWRHDTPAPRVAVRLQGLAPNTQGTGAKIKLLDGAVPMQSAEVISGGRYLSGSDPERVFAAGKSQSMTIEVTWRNGTRSIVHNARPNRIYEINEAGAAAAEPKPIVEATNPLFKDVSHLLPHRHHQESFDDYARQPLLPRQLSHDGPGIAWVNLDGGPRESLVIGTDRGGQLEAFTPNGSGPFTRTLSTTSNEDALTGIVGWIQPDGKRSLAVGHDNYESRANSATILLASPASGTLDTVARLPAIPESSGPLASADIYGDGTLGLFVGGRVLPGRYPQAASSSIYRNVSGRMEFDTNNTAVLEKVGLVSGAVWSDLDGDGYPELILACEWGPIRVFKNNHGQLHEITKDLGLDQFTGWWRGVTTGDIDGDGLPDIIASNWGLNSDYQATTNHPARIYYGDFTDRGALDLIEAVYDPMFQAEVPRRTRDALATAWPPLVGKYSTHETYSHATIDQILALLPKSAGKVEATTLASMVFFNRTNHFDAVELPYEAQIAPAFAVNVADFDGDGLEDIFLSQNFFAVQPDEPRLDAGRGLLLRGIGGGKLEAVPGQKSGILVYGEQRGAAVCDFDGDGRVDLALTQNGAETRLYQNVGAKPGLRVRLAGPPGNPDGIGATIRPVFGQRMGPAREIHGGSGYWSQDSAVQVLGGAEPPTQIWIRWPGGQTTTSAISAAAREITVATDGKTTVIR